MSLLAAVMARPLAAQAGSDEPAVRFVVMTDVHFGRGDAVEKVSRSIKNLLGRADGADALLVTGDMTNNGSQPQYDLAKRTFDSCVPQSVPCYFVMGNHDRYTDTDVKNSRFSRTFGQKADTVVDINGYKFILLSMCTPYGRNAYDREFLARSLSQARDADPAKPIFLFYHVPTEGTVYGSYEIGGKDSWGTGVVADILAAYPQVIAFSGHSHYPLRDERSIHRGAFTSVNVGTTSYSEYEVGTSEGFHPRGYLDVSEGLVVDVMADGRVVLNRWDTRRDEEIGRPWVVTPPYPGDCHINIDKVRPRFARRARVSTEITGAGALEVSFPQAFAGSSDTHHYLIRIFDRKGNPVPGRGYTVFSGLHLGSAMPAEIKWKVKGLSPGKYRAMVTAVDSFGNHSRTLQGAIVEVQ